MSQPGTFAEPTTLAGYILPGMLHALGYALLASETLEEFCKRQARYWALVAHSGNYSVGDDGTELKLAAVAKNSSLCFDTEDTFCAPYPDSSYKAGARAYPSLVPVAAGIPDVAENRRAWAVFEHWQKPFICCFSDGDPITRGGDAQFLQRIPGTKGQPHTTLRGGHFIQEDDPQNFARLAIEACGYSEGTQP